MTPHPGSRTSPPSGSRFTCSVESGASFEVTSFEVTGARPVLLEMVARGANAVPVGCRGGGCGVCRVQVTDGDYETLKMSRRHVSDEDRAIGCALACRLVALSDLVIRLAPRP